jgi:hypothetical protein
MLDETSNLYSLIQAALRTGGREAIPSLYINFPKEIGYEKELDINTYC